MRVINLFHINGTNSNQGPERQDMDNQIKVGGKKEVIIIIIKEQGSISLRRKKSFNFIQTIKWTHIL